MTTIAPLTDDEKEVLLDFSRPGGKSGLLAWNAMCKDVKDARQGKYPPDWHKAVIRGNLFAENGLPPPRTDGLEGVEPELAEFIRGVRETPLPSYVTKAIKFREEERAAKFREEERAASSGAPPSAK